MTMNSQDALDWNVLTNQWLKVTDLNAEIRVYSPLEGLKRSSTIRCIAAANPLDLFASYRFLVTLLYWKADVGGGVHQLRKSLLRGEMPRIVLDAIEAETSAFRLFDGQSPFLQDPLLKNMKKQYWKSAGSLFAELACGTNIAHFHHGDDIAMRLCLPCATIGMLRIVPWTQAGGAGLSPAVHNAPPIVAMAIGENLTVMLGLNLVELRGKAGEARWSGHFKPSDGHAAIPYMEAFTWNPRRVYLRSVEANGICWRCGCHEVPVVGPVFYAKNENTQLTKKGRKTIPFIWQDPSAFYDPDAPYVAIKSYDEEFSARGRDLIGLIGSKDARPTAAVLQSNIKHHGWRLVVPCTNPANNKTYDHRQLEVASLSSDVLRDLVPAAPLPWRQQEVDGWTSRNAARLPNGATVFVQSAIRLLTHADWTVLACAAYRPMHESPAAFDLLSGLLWALRGRKVSRLPSRNVAWLILKLMGAVPSDVRVLRHKSTFCPLDVLPKRQLERRGGRGARSPYPVSLPRGPRLEAALRSAIAENMRKRTPEPIDWAGLCCALDELLSQKQNR
ncbi:type I-E CRISPR-associated protein Cse1/CasA [Anaerobaca lacustris]|uniref:Type I-E CRISPR-associated protein Cse1/CasA n=1 Tax=Anaerobaca lacustris TaxID=3044600 RepID=A0AAW6TXR3_9BACT|nr:type I-E CRISPR-associated protein Cse1/CasA [Sedimentisphaerales bacterium M17dextr]